MARWALCVVALLAAAGAIAFLLHTRQLRQRGVASLAARAGLAIPVRTATVREETITEVAGGPGVTRPSREVEVSLLSLRLGQDRTDSYRIEKVHVAMGSVVRRGDLLLQLKPDIHQGLVRSRNAERNASREQLARLEAQLKTAKHVRELLLASAEADVAFAEAATTWRDSDHARVRRLFDDGTATETELGEARNNVAQAKSDVARALSNKQRARDDVANGAEIDAAQLATALAAVANTERALQAAEVELEQCQVMAPLAGIVRSVDVEEGETVPGGSPLVTIIKLDPIVFVAEMPQERIDLIRRGAEAECTLDVFPRESFTGTIVRISPQVHPATRAFDVVIEVPNPTSRLKSGLSGYARVSITRRATTIPAAAVVERGKRVVAFVVETDHAHLRPIAIGRRVGIDHFEVANGISSGTSVVIHGLRHLRDGAAVNTDWREWALRPDADVAVTERN